MIGLNRKKHGEERQKEKKQKEKKPLLSEIEWKDASNDILVWKSDIEDFNTSSVLNVRFSQIAVFVKDGMIADCFSGGRYVLETKNIPILRKLMEIPTGGISTFKSEVYFVNKVEAMSQEWALKDQVLIQEPEYDVNVKINVAGTMSFSLHDPTIVLLKMVGAERCLTKEVYMEKLWGIVSQEVSASIADLITKQQVKLSEASLHYKNLADALNGRLKETFAKYGAILEAFTIDSIFCNDPIYEGIRSKVGGSKEKIIDAKTEQQVIDILGTTYQEKRQLDIAEKAAENPGNGIANSMVGVAMGVQIAGMAGNAVKSVTHFGPQDTHFQKEGQGQFPQEGEFFSCKCGADIRKGQKFCSNCGAKYCPKCGQELNSDARFCSSCGLRL